MTSTPRINELYNNMIRDALRLKREVKLKRENEAKPIASSASAANLSNSDSLHENKESSNVMLNSEAKSEMGSEHQIIKIHPWLIIFSDALEKPFYYNQITKMGQFKVCQPLFIMIYL